MIVEADVAIIGTGAGGGTAAEILSARGLHVVMIEEGPHRTSADFHMREAQAYPDLYQESAGRKTKDKSITILQGRSVGGSTTVNWTSSFRTPAPTLAVWQQRYGLHDLSQAELAPWFEMMEKRLHIAPWATEPNENNAILARGAARLGIPTRVIPRNVHGCLNLGYCGMGCPVNAKQSMLVTTIPAALKHGAKLYSRMRAERLVLRGETVTELQCVQMDDRGISPTPNTLTVRAKQFILAAGAIGTPALLLRSALPDPNGLTGKRTFLHPVVISAALMPDDVDGFAGAPQSIYSDHFIERQPVEGPIGFKLEVPPLHPILTATTFTGFGNAHAQTMANFSKAHAMIALLRDGFHDESRGGAVELKSDGTPLLDYHLSPYLWEGARRALRTMAQIQFAAGASTVMPLHEDAVPYRNLRELDAALDRLPMEPLRTRVVSAHVMGGAAMSADPKEGVVDSHGRHHHLANVSIFDGSVFPTSIGANPQLSIYGLVARNASALARALKP